MAAPLFRRLAGRGSFFSAVSLSDGLDNLRSLLSRCSTLQDAALFSRKDPLYECGRPQDTKSYLFLLLMVSQSQSTVTQDVQQTKDIDLSCYKTLPTKSVSCQQVEPMLLEWLQLQDPINLAFHLPIKITMTNIRKMLFQLTLFTLDARCSSTTSGTSARAHHVVSMVIHVVRLICSLCSSPCSFPCVSPIP